MIPFSAITILKVLWDLWNRIPSAIKVIIIVIIAAFIGFKMGERKQIQICNIQKQESINEARRIDREASASAKARMEEQNKQYLQQALNAENALNAAKDYYAKLPVQCQIDENFIERNNSIGIGDGMSDTIPGNKKRTPGRK